MKIVIIKVKQKNKNNSNCVIDFICENEFGSTSENTLELAMDLVLKYKISIGGIFSNSAWEIILAEQKLLSCKKIAYNFASQRFRTQKQIIEKLKSQNFSAAEIEAALNFLVSYNLINDLEFSKKYIYDILLRKRIGVFKLKQDLLVKGVAKEIAEKAIYDFYPAEDVSNLIKKEIEKKLRQIAHKPKEKHKQLLINYLINKGFIWQDICNVLDDFADILNYFD